MFAMRPSEGDCEWPGLYYGPSESLKSRDRAILGNNHNETEVGAEHNSLARTQSGPMTDLSPQ